MHRYLATAALLGMVPHLAIASIVTFGAPDRLTVPDGTTATWSMNVAPTLGFSGWTGSCLYHAINTKGNGTAGRCTISPSTTSMVHLIGGITHSCELTLTSSVTGEHETVEYKDNDRTSSGGFQFNFTDELVDSSGNNAGFAPVIFTLTADALNGATFVGSPTATVDANADGFDMSAVVSVPSGVDTSTTNTFSWTETAATAVPEPASIGTVVAVAALVGRRRR